MSKNYKYKLSIITATYNAEKYLPRLIESLRVQEDKDFEWVVADGASNDSTLKILEAVDDLNIKVISQQDFGIYDALNRAIKACNGEFYLVMGADDILYPNGIKDYKTAITGGQTVDVVTANICVGRQVKKVSRAPLWLARQFHYVTGHAVGSVYRTGLHAEVGYYSNRYPIAADQLFILKIFQKNITLKVINRLVGEHDIFGVSHMDRIGSLTERYRIMLELGFNKYIQTMIFILTLFKRII